MGPKVNKPEVDKLDKLVNDAVRAGAKVLVGGNRLSAGVYQRGFWFEPTVITGVDHSMDIMHQEIFGPVVPVQKVSGFEQAIELANDSEYGLSAYLFTEDMRRIMKLVGELEFREIYVNRTMGEMVQGFHNGFKMSGIGGEDGKHGLENYLQRRRCT